MYLSPESTFEAEQVNTRHVESNTMAMISGRTSLIVLLLGCLSISVPAAAGGDEIAKGRTLYIQHCAACHGMKGDGHGPLEHELSTPPPDLRLLSKRYGDPLPEDQIARFMDGRADVKAHGPRDMPVWGDEMWRYPEGQGNPTQVSDSVAEIIHYLQTIQTDGHRASLERRPPLIVVRAVSPLAWSIVVPYQRDKRERAAASGTISNSSFEIAQ